MDINSKNPDITRASRGILGKLLAAYVAIMLAGLIFVGLPLHLALRSDYIANAAHSFKKLVEDQTPEIAQAIFADNRAALNEHCRSLNKNFRGRVTLFSPEGEIVGDSIGYYCLLQARPDCVEAIRLGLSHEDIHTIGMADTFAINTAVELNDEEQALARLTLPLWPLYQQIRYVRTILAVGVVGTGALALLAGLILSRRIASPLTRMTHVAENIASGNFDDDLTLEGGKDVIGRLEGAIDTMRSNLRQHVETIEGERHKLLAVLHNMTEGVLAVSEDGHIILFNKAFENLLEMRGRLKNDEHFENTDLPPNIINCIWEVRENKTPVLIETGEFKNDERVIAVSAGPVERSGSGSKPACGVVVVAHDITHAKKIESMGRELVANASHEMRTPLAGMSTAVETLIESGAITDPQILEILNIISRQTGRLKKLVDETLQMSRLDSLGGLLSPEPLDIEHIINESIVFFAEELKAKNLSLKVDVQEDIQEPEGDAQLLLLAIRNLVANAIRYTPESGKISIRAYNESDEMVVEVADTGVGIGLADQPRIFERFFRAQSNHNKEDGVGLGLTIVRKVAKLHDGSVDFDSAPSEGSRFFIRIPLNN